MKTVTDKYYTDINDYNSWRPVL